MLRKLVSKYIFQTVFKYLTIQTKDIPYKNVFFKFLFLIGIFAHDQNIFNN